MKNKVSIIMPTYNTPYEFLQASVDSILNQTYKDFELIIIDDHSTNYNDAKKIKEITHEDSRIKWLTNTNTKGVAGALNTGLQNATGDYIVRMDSDDIALTDRLERQIQVLEENKDIAFVAGYAKCFGASKRWHKSPVNNTAIKTSLIFESGIVHPTVCIRKSMLDLYSLRYNEHVQNEDYELWIRCALHKDFVFYTLPQKVLNYRVHEGQVTKQRIEKLKMQGVELRKQILQLLEVELTEEETDIFVAFSLGMPFNATNKELMNVLSSIKSKARSRDIFVDKGIYNNTFNIICTRKYLKLILKGKLSYIPGLIQLILRSWFKRK